MRNLDEFDENKDQVCVKGKVIILIILIKACRKAFEFLELKLSRMEAKGLNTKRCSRISIFPGTSSCSGSSIGLAVDVTSMIWVLILFGDILAFGSSYLRVNISGVL